MSMENILGNSRLCVSDEKYTRNKFLLKCYMHVLSSDNYLLHPVGFTYKIDNNVILGSECGYVFFPQLYVSMYYEPEPNNYMINLLGHILLLKEKRDFDYFYEIYKHPDNKNSTEQIIDWKKVYSYYGGIEIHKYDTETEKSEKKEWWIDWPYSGCIWNSDIFYVSKLG